MKKYRVKVNGKMYEVELEEIESNDSSIKQTDSKPISSDGGQKVKSLMQGVIVDIKVSTGQKIVKGQTLVILETMKMENEIVSPFDGTVSNIYVSKQDTVENQEVLMIIN